MGDELTEKVVGAAIEVHRVLGPGLLESIDEEALCVELARRGVPFDRQVAVDVNYKGHPIKGLKVDLLVAGEVIVELKSVAAYPEGATAQVLSYLKATGLRRGLLMNFGCRLLVDGIKRLSLSGLWPSRRSREAVNQGLQERLRQLQGLRRRIRPRPDSAPPDPRTARR
ncbi:MAG TPA: GxxExxY protein, partial [Isosphaeraceae bacterium]|nr:GxxExxY protein [Isosphaeraceae bacterium]